MLCQLAARAPARARAAAAAVATAPPPAVDAAAYPLHDPPRCRPLLDQCRAEVARHGYCHLPNFLRPEAVVGLVGECRRLEADGRGFRSHEAHNVFLEDAGADGVGLRSKEFASSKVLMAMDDMEPRSPLLAIYRWPALRRFLQDAFGLPRLFRSADPLGGAYYNIFDGAFGDTLGWHFDRSSFSTSLILQTTPGAGGDFQYAPDSRQAICEMGSWEEVEQHLDGRVLTPPLHPGSLYLFAGNRSLHRVSPVAHGKRINAIFTFVEEEGATLNEYTLRKFFGRTGPRAPRPGSR